MKTGPLKPRVAFCAASRRSSRFPAFSRFSKFTGMEARRLLSWRGSQKWSVIFTSVKGTARSFRSGESARAVANVTNRTDRTNERILFFRFDPQHCERIAGEGAGEGSTGDLHRL